MKYYNERTEQQLGFDRLRELLIGRANTEEGKELCRRLRPYRKPGGVEIELSRVLECKELLEFDETFSLDVTDSMQAVFDHSSVDGNWLVISDLFRFLKWLRMVRDLITYFRSRKEKYPHLWAGFERLEWKKDLVAGLSRIVDDKGNMKDDASPKLKILRRQRMSLSSDLRRQLNSILRHAAQNGWTEATEITIRNDRYVVPLNADFKGRVKGFVHDVSQSGRTVFVEPSSVLDANNRIREVLLEEKNEITRILIEATGWIREELDNLKDYSKSVARLDFIRAKARLAVETKAVKPVFDRKAKKMHIVQARHPLLMIKDGMSYEQVIPLSIILEPQSRIILISGPNAGGKSVSLKTIGLLQLMLQSGMLIPCNEASEFTWFDKLFIDIGDEQSIQSDLSTYTSHLANMQVMINSMDKRSLFLVDEFGSGTDPRLGGAMAEAFLEKFLASGAYGVITTHYGNLKNFADNNEGIVNAAMQFDPRNLSPTYQIEVGIPGRSYAFEIARNVGIPETLLDRAKSKVDGEQLHSEELLLKLEEQKAELESVLKEQKENNAELKHWLKRNQEMNRMLKEQESRILREAHQSAQSLINEANAKIERTIKEIVTQAMDLREAILSADAENDSRFNMSQSIADFHIRSMMCAPLIDSDGNSLGVIQIDTLDQRNRFAAEDLDVLAGVSRQASLAVDNANLHETAMQQQAIERELHLARQVQQSFLPDECPEIASYSFFDFYEPAQRVGGDYFDYVELPNNRVAVVLADVSGKGIAAALLMAKLSSEMRISLLTESCPAVAVGRVNASLASQGLDDRFVTLVLALLDTSTHRLTLVNAGHMPPLLRHASGDVEEVGEEATGIPLGIDEDFEYESTDFDLAAGDMLSMFTDGISEAMSPEGDLYGLERLRERVAQQVS